MVNLKKLNMYDTHCNIPESFYSLRNLENLKCDDISTKVCNFVKLKRLSCTLKIFHPEIGLLTTLKKLRVRGCFSEIPKAVSYLTNLEKLKICQYFKSCIIPEEIYNLRNLKILHINGMNNISKSISKLVNLTKLDMSDTNME